MSDAPRLLVLQALNTAIGCAVYLAFATATGHWTAVGWTPSAIGAAMTAANLAYAGLVAQGGRLSDRWGRARTAILGASVIASGALAAALLATPSAALLGCLAACAGSALFFPGNVGLFSDARGRDGAPDPPLHRKVSRYNMGWSAGNIAGFAGAWLLAGLPPAASWALIASAALACVAVLWRWRRLPPRPPPAAGDRAPHPALPLLTWMSRGALLILCLGSMAYISLLARCLAGEGLDPTAAQRLASAALLVFAVSYCLAFGLLGRWTGWILRPRRLVLLQGSLLLAALLVSAVGHSAAPSAALLCLASACFGLGFASAYTGSIYYSLRLPEGAARAAALHETALGIGSTAGPLLAGLSISQWGDGALGALGSWLLAVGGAALALQLACLPALARRGAR
ncbi:MAG: MFS transporter [Planctomycetota bacterium]|nr:MFS transporter [Planctomycetota bacterium]MDW8373481.1 MFS transporter [Planctomycetota bacterium]